MSQGGHLDWGGKCATHRRYLMSCDDLEELWVLSQGRCDICGARGPDTESGHLHIDHDSGRGWWAVRGLLCCSCNTQWLPWALKHPASYPEVAKYLAKSWYRTMLVQRNVAIDMSAEPVAGAVVLAKGQRFRRNLRGWEREPQALWSDTRSWRWLYHRYGPHNIRIVANDLDSAA